MATLVQCPTCGRQLPVPDVLLGQPVRCPACGGQFHAGTREVLSPGRLEAPSAQAPLPEAVREDGAESPANSDPGPPVPVTKAGPELVVPTPPPGLVTCWACAEHIPPEALVCPHCGEPRDHPEDSPDLGVRRDLEPHRGGLILTLGILSIVTGAVAMPLACLVVVPLVADVIGLALGISAWVLGGQDLARMRRGLLDPDGRATTQAGRVCGIIGTVLNLLFLITCGGLVGLYMGGWLFR